ncbi:MAG: hypothetical protein ACJ0HH_01230 [Candidatus Thalassarchaeum sp.]
MSDEDLETRAAQHITQGDFMGAMGLCEAHVEANPDDPSGYHGWAEAALFEIQQNGNIDDNGNDRINEGQVAAYFRKASSLVPDNAEYLAAHANALLEFDRIPMAVRELQKLRDLGASSEEVDVSFHLYEAARMLIDAVDLKTDLDRSHPFARQYVPVAIEFALLGLGFPSAQEATEYLAEE